MQLKVKLSSIKIILFFIGIFCMSCKKSPDEGSVIYGNITLDLHMKHHYWDVPYLKVYMKKDATTFPGSDTTLYEYKGHADASSNITFNRLMIGKYFIYATGYDSLYQSQVIGRLPINLTSENIDPNHATVTLQVDEI
jgi:hypothetical protein